MTCNKIHQSYMLFYPLPLALYCTSWFSFFFFVWNSQFELSRKRLKKKVFHGRNVNKNETRILKQTIGFLIHSITFTSQLSRGKWFNLVKVVSHDWSYKSESSFNVFFFGSLNDANTSGNYEWKHRGDDDGNLKIFREYQLNYSIWEQLWNERRKIYASMLSYLFCKRKSSISSV